MYKVLKKVKEMKNGYRWQAYPIKLENNDFPSGQDKAEAFVNLFAENSLSSNLNPSIIKFRKEEEQKEEYKDAVSLLEFPVTVWWIYRDLGEFLHQILQQLELMASHIKCWIICLIVGNSYYMHFTKNVG